MQHLISALVICILLGCLWACQNGTIGEGDRVRLAYNETFESLSQMLKKKQIDKKNFRIFLRAFKQEQKLELWVRNKIDTNFQLLKSYDFCKTSGDLGPKRKEGDYQIPEGLYHIERFNPISSFYLSLGLNYPNKSDKLLGDPSSPGSDIFIHGGCATVGCIPITNPLIKEVYTMANQAREQGQTKIPVHIFPSHLTENTIDKLIEENADWEKHRSFWTDLKPIYEHFEKNKQLPDFKIDEQGVYKLSE